MAYDYGSNEFSNILGSNLRSANDYKESFVETDSLDSLQMVNLENISIPGEYYVIKRYHSGLSMILDHSLYGLLDTSTLLLDGQYLIDETSTSTFPLSFSILFTTTIVGSELYASGIL